MYGEVVLMPDDGRRGVDFTLVWRDWLAPDMPPLSDDEAAARKDAVKVFLRNATQTPAAWRQTCLGALEQVAVQVASADQLDTALDLAVAHFQLSPDRQQARVDAIAAGFAAEFDDVLQEGEAWAPLGRLIGDLRTRALLMPQALLEPCIREACLTLRTQILTTSGQYTDALPAAYESATRWLARLAQSNDYAWGPALSMVIWTRRAADRPGLMDRLEWLLQHGGMGTVAQAWRFAMQQNALEQPVMVGDFIANVINDVVPGDVDGSKDLPVLLASHWELLLQRHETLLQRGVVDALDAARSSGALPRAGAPGGVMRIFEQWMEMSRSLRPMPAPQAARASLTLSASSSGHNNDGAYAAQCQI